MGKRKTAIGCSPLSVASFRFAQFSPELELELGST
jgi:hypothetical protein